MKPFIRYQSQLLNRRSYKPARLVRRRLGVTFRPERSFALQVAPRIVNQAPAAVSCEVTALSG